MTKIQADAYITAYSTLEEHVFIAPCVVTTNDNWMGRTEKRFGNVKGPTIRRGARIGGGAILCPAIEIGEEAFVGAGAVVTKDVPPRAVVVGNPARVLREVPDEELLENSLAGGPAPDVAPPAGHSKLAELDPEVVVGDAHDPDARRDVRAREPDADDSGFGGAAAVRIEIQSGRRLDRRRKDRPVRPDESNRPGEVGGVDPVEHEVGAADSPGPVCLVIRRVERRRHARDDRVGEERTQSGEIDAVLRRPGRATRSRPGCRSRRRSVHCERPSVRRYG